MGAQGFHMTIAKALELEPELKELYQKIPQAQRLLDLAQKSGGLRPAFFGARGRRGNFAHPAHGFYAGANGNRRR